MFSGPVNRARSAPEHHAIEVRNFELGVHCARFEVQFARLPEPGSDDLRTALWRLCGATIHGLLPHMGEDACRKCLRLIGREGR
jgi:hypothetical protein